uniref:Potassium channel domain-containing protein n=1 Tax=Clastoptera arizonana TaxID=38151 RepID=A0A1B6C1K9_9HEMI
MPASSAPVRCLASWLTHNLILSLIVLGYVLLGGIVFQALEGGHELRHRTIIKNFRDDCLKELWLITERLNVLYERNWTHLVDAQLRKFERSVVETTKASGYHLQDKEMHWSFSGALLYSVTVVTTIGYGNIAPKTAVGKVVTIVYALVGVPLMLMCLSNLGSLLASAFQLFYSHICCWNTTNNMSDRRNTSCRIEYSKSRQYTGNHTTARATLVAVGTGCGRAVCSLTPDGRQYLNDSRSRQVTEMHEHESDEDETENTRGRVAHDTPSRVPLIWRGSGESRRPPTPPPRKTPPLYSSHPPKVPAVLVLLMLSSYIGLGAMAFAAWEDWTFLDGAYFCFVTLSTIGFGDLMPGKSLQRVDSVEGQYETIACCVYLLLGLVVIAMSFSLLQDEVVSKSRHLANSMGLIKKESLVV